MTKPQYGWDHQKERELAVKRLQRATMSSFAERPMDKLGSRIARLPPRQAGT